jgi:Protein of unknown function (DUF4245)
VSDHGEVGADVREDMQDAQQRREQEALARQEAARRRERLRASALDMLRSLAVVLAIVLAVVVVAPRSTMERPDVDVEQAAGAARPAAPFDLSVPQGLPDGWDATSARLSAGPSQVLTWHVGYTTPAGAYAAVKQAQDPTRVWIEDATEAGEAQPPREVDGDVWEASEDGAGRRSLLRVENGVTTVVTGSAEFGELEVLVRSLGTP